MLRLDGVSRKRKDFCLQDISFCVPDGYITGLVGKNGAGKTTLIHTILDMERKDAGTIELDGMDNVRQSVLFKDAVGFVMEDAGFLPCRSAKENGRLLGELYTSWSQERFYRYLHSFGFTRRMYEATLLCELSKGMYIRFQLAFALAHRPRLLLLDEPTANLDPVFRMEFLKILQTAIEQEELGVLFATHITSDLDKIADYLVVLSEGNVCCNGDRETVLEHFGTTHVAEAALQAIRGAERKNG